MQGEQATSPKDKYGKREIDVDLIEQTPAGKGLGHWLLASPMLLFLTWLWIDVFNYYSSLSRVADYTIGLVLFALVIVLPVGLLAHRLVTAMPGIFHHAGWDVRPLEPIRPAEQYMVTYRYRMRHRADFGWSRAWTRAGQGWVFLEIAAIFVGAVAMIPLFFSATDFGFGRR